MNHKEIREIKKRFREEYSNITEIVGCYVSSTGEIISEFRASAAMMKADEREKYYQLFRKSLSGKVGKNLQNLVFRTAQVAENESYKLLYNLKQTKLKDDALVEELYRKIITAVKLDSAYVIIAGYDSYDVPFKGKDGALFSDESDSVFSYFTCVICPVSLTKAELTWVQEEAAFHNRGTDSVIGAPVAGFLYPAFDDRRTNLYGALYYSKGTANNFPELIDAVFEVDKPETADAQKAKFSRLLTDALGEDCNLHNLYAIEELLEVQQEIAKEAGDRDIPVITCGDVCDRLEERGVVKERIEELTEAFGEEFGIGAELPVSALKKTGKGEIKLQDIVIKLSAEMKDLVEIRTIGENKYIMIRIDEGVEYNGIDLNL